MRLRFRRNDGRVFLFPSSTSDYLAEERRLLLIRYLSLHSRESLFIPIISLGGLASPIALSRARVFSFIFLSTKQSYARSRICRSLCSLNFALTIRLRRHDCAAEKKGGEKEKREGRYIQDDASFNSPFFRKSRKRAWRTMYPLPLLSPPSLSLSLSLSMP
jgi:hypothetical protein